MSNVGEWVARDDRVPNNRRVVLAWGTTAPLLRVRCLGFTRFNMDRDGGSFDCERPSLMFYNRVTHWCDIVGPSEKQKAPPPVSP